MINSSEQQPLKLRIEVEFTATKEKVEKDPVLTKPLSPENVSNYVRLLNQLIQQ